MRRFLFLLIALGLAFPAAAQVISNGAGLGANTYLGVQAVNLGNGVAPAAPTGTALNVVFAGNGAVNLDSIGGVSQYIGRRGNGSAASLTNVVSGNGLLQFQARGYDGTAWSGTRAAIVGSASQDWTTSAHGTQLGFATTTNDTITQVTRFTLGNDGFLIPGANNTYDFGSSALALRYIYAGSAIVTKPFTVGGLPAAATAGAGARSFVTDALACTFAAAVTGGGAVSCPVYSDGAAWKAG